MYRLVLFGLGANFQTRANMKNIIKMDTIKIRNINTIYMLSEVLKQFSTWWVEQWINRLQWMLKQIEDGHSFFLPFPHSYECGKQTEAFQ